ncbi:MAG TPA: VWA domain-containing protein [Thermoanaerobaculia bacterium]|nr:VWA domain-containing protein [Thermoanaerobaculia bacterium]
MKNWIIAALLASAFPLAAQTPFEERVDVDLVLLDVTVTDREGNQILGLRKDDFIVTENGVEQPIDSMDYFTNRRLLDAPEAQAQFQVERNREARYFILFFHEIGDPGMIPGYRSELMRARQAAGDWIRDEIQPQDLVAVAGFDTRLKIYADFTNDRKILESALHGVTGFSNGLREVPDYAGSASIMREINVRKMVNQTGRIFDALQMMGDALRSFPARKQMVVFSHGIGEPSTLDASLPDHDERRYRPMAGALNRANVTVDAISMLRSSTRIYGPEQILARLADETGGEFYRNFATFQTPLDRVEELSSGYYLLSYRTHRKESEHGYQRVKVKLRNPEFEVRAREGYAY